jgi:hypothetical protein
MAEEKAEEMNAATLLSGFHHGLILLERRKFD